MFKVGFAVEIFGNLRLMYRGFHVHPFVLRLFVLYCWSFNDTDSDDLAVLSLTMLDVVEYQYIVPLGRFL